jgi:hypothetical protein
MYLIMFICLCVYEVYKVYMAYEVYMVYKLQVTGKVINIEILLYIKILQPLQLYNIGKFELQDTEYYASGIIFPDVWK